jgi:ParB family chromosome partitioning protein
MPKGLGKGLGALISNAEKGQKSDSLNILNIEIAKIKPNKYQPRKEFDPVKLNDLISSIQEKGIIQPISVRKINDNEYELIAGERRMRAAKAAGFDKVPAIVKDVKDEDMLELAIIENIQRDDLNPIEEANAYNRLLEEFELTHDDLSKKVGKDRSTITNTLRLLNLPINIQEHVSRGTISMGHARVLLALEEPSTKMDICEHIIKGGLSVRQAEQLVGKLKKGREKNIREQMKKDVHVLDAEKQLQYVLGTKVRIKGKKSGKIEIYYHNLEDLNRIYEIIKKVGK